VEAASAGAVVAATGVVTSVLRDGMTYRLDR
jgi:hypothetical protein